jgi:AcrR family transcriptional regulator
LKAAQKTRKPDPNTKDKIIDAAEALFSTRGYYGTTTREITREAGVPLGLMSYYFGTKADLYSEVIIRRSGEHVAAIRKSVDDAQKGKDGQPATVSDMVKAFFAPMVERSLYSGPGWKAYIQLLSRAGNTPLSEPYVAAFHENYAPVENDFIKVLQTLFPDAKEEDIYWSFYFLTSTIIHILVQGGSIDEWSGGKYLSSDLETVMDKLGPFLEAGISRLANS